MGSTSKKKSFIALTFTAVFLPSILVQHVTVNVNDALRSSVGGDPGGAGVRVKSTTRLFNDDNADTNTDANYDSSKFILVSGTADEQQQAQEQQARQSFTLAFGGHQPQQIPETPQKIQCTRGRQKEGEESTGTTQQHDKMEKKKMTMMMPSESNMWCPAALLEAGAEFMSSSHVWRQLHPQLVNASQSIHPDIRHLNMTQREAYTDWIHQLFSYYTGHRLRRSIMTPAPPKIMVQLLKLASEIRHHNAALDGFFDKDEKNDTASSTVGKGGEKRSLRILVFGGSVTAGMGCDWPERSGLENLRGMDCAWPNHLEKFLNGILFEGEEVVQVDNVAIGGTTSEFGSMALKYRLFPDPDRVPDVIISAYSANEAHEPDGDKVLYDFMQDFVEAARDLHPCNDNAPLVMLVDDLYGDMPYSATLQTGNLYMLSTWSNLMAVNYGNTVKYKILAETRMDDNEGNHDSQKAHPLLTSPFVLHNGIGMHLGMALTIAFNIVNSMVDICNDGSLAVHDYRIEEEYIPPKYWDMDSNVFFDDTKVMAVEEKSSHAIEADLLSNVQRGEPPFKHFGRMEQGIPGTAAKVVRDLRDNMIRKQKSCQNHGNNTKTEGEDSLKHRGPKCEYSWIVDHTMTSEQLDDKMSRVLRFNYGWSAEGHPIDKPRTGWYAHSPNATFSIQMKRISFTTDFVLILSKKSWWPTFKGSKLAVSARVANQITAQVQDSSGTMDLKDDDSWSHINGYHEVRTGVKFPHKIPIQGAGAASGDSLILDVKLVEGSEFMISGIAFCSS